MVLEYAMSIGFDVEGLDFSPIKGPEGNIEYLAFLTKTSDEKGTLKYHLNLLKWFYSPIRS